MTFLPIDSKNSWAIDLTASSSEMETDLISVTFSRAPSRVPALMTGERRKLRSGGTGWENRISYFRSFFIGSTCAWKYRTALVLTPWRSARNEDFLSAVLSRVSTLDAKHRGVKGDGTGRLERGWENGRNAKWQLRLRDPSLGRPGRKLSERPRQEARDWII